MSSTVHTAIIPVAGLGTRFLPATKATPKELLPVIDTPLIQYAIDEARSAGIKRLIFVSNPSKSAIEKYVMEDAQLQVELRSKGMIAIADSLNKASLSYDVDDVAFVMQHQPLGLGHAVLQAREHVLPGAIAVILPDDLILGRGCIGEMVDVYEKTRQGHLVASMPVPASETANYGMLSVVHRNGSLLKADTVVEKPLPKDAPSLDAVVGRYILHPSIFETLATLERGKGNEIQLTDAIAKDAASVGLSGFQFSGRRFDCGSKAGMLRATLYVASGSPELSGILASYVGEDKSAYAA